MVFSGFLVPRVESGLGGEPWQLIWAGFGFIEIFLCLLAAWFLRSRPSELGLTPYGDDPGPMANSRAAGPGLADRRAATWGRMLHLGAIYLLFGVTCLTYATFIVTTMVDHLHVSDQEAGFLWACVGGLSIFSGAIFGLVADRFGHHIGMLSAFFVQAVAYGLVATQLGSWAMYSSLLLFGLSAWSLPPIIAAAVGDYLGAERAAGGFAAVTIMFAIGQVLGPAGAGVLAGITGDFGISYGIAVGLNTLAMLLCVLLGRSVRRQRA
jgi:MFS family permease